MASHLKWNIILIGESGVGKTALCARFMKNRFPTKYNSTIVVDRLSKKIQLHDTVMDVQIWDTAGKEFYRSLLPQYFRSAHGCILVYDVTSVATLEKLPEWLLEFRASNGKAPVILVGNKSENPACEAINQNISSVIDQQDMEFMECSAETGENVDKVFELLIQKIWDNTFPKKVLKNTNIENSSVHQKSEENDSPAPQESTESNSCVQEKSNKPKKSILSNEANYSLHQISQETYSSVNEKSDELRKSTMPNEGNSSISQKSTENNSPIHYKNSECGNVITLDKENNFSVHEKSGEHRKFIIPNEKNSPLYQRPEQNNSTVHQESDKFKESIMLNEKNSPIHPKTEENNSSVQTSNEPKKFTILDEENSSIHEKSTKNNSSTHEKLGECRKSIIQNTENNSYIQQKSGKTKISVVSNEVDSLVHQKSKQNSFSAHQISSELDNLMMRNLIMWRSVMVNEENSSIQEKSKKNNLFPHEKSSDSSKPIENNSSIHDTFSELTSVMLNEENFSVHQKSEKNNPSIQVKSEKKTFFPPVKSEKSLMLNEEISLVHRKCKENSSFTRGKSGKAKRSVKVNNENFVKSLRFIEVVTLGSKKCRKLSVLKLS